MLSGSLLRLGETHYAMDYTAFGVTFAIALELLCISEMQSFKCCHVQMYWKFSQQSDWKSCDNLFIEHKTSATVIKEKWILNNNKKNSKVFISISFDLIGIMSHWNAWLKSTKVLQGCIISGWSFQSFFSFTLTFIRYSYFTITLK